MNTRPIRMTVLATLAASALAAFVPASAQTGAAPVELRFATVAPQRSVWGMQLERLGKHLEEEARGGLKFNFIMGPQLGGELDIVQQVARGRLDGGGVGAAFAAALAPELQLLTLPMFFRSAAEMDCAIDRHLAPTVAERLAAKGVHVIAWGDSGTLEMVGKRAYTRPADVAGTKAGSWGSRIGVILWQALGANPTATNAAEVTSALQTGLIDLVSVVPAFYVPTGMNKVAPVVTRMDMMFLPSLSLVNKAAWERLSPDQQAALTRAVARTPMPVIRQEVRALQQQLLDAHVQAGGQVVQATTEQREAFRQVLSAAWPRMAQEAGPEGPAFLARMEAARQACASGS